MEGIENTPSRGSSEEGGEGGGRIDREPISQFERERGWWLRR